MNIDLTISNYRCFSRSNPARIRLTPGFTALVGPNNAGKTALLTFFFEFRGLFESASSYRPHLNQAIGGNEADFSIPGSEPSDLFFNQDCGPIELTVEVRDALVPLPAGPVVDTAIFTIPRDASRYSMRLYSARTPIAQPHDWTSSGVPRNEAGEAIADLSAVYAACRVMSRMFLIGATRTPLPYAGGQERDTAIGAALISSWQQLKGGSSKADRRRAASVAKALGSTFGFADFDIDPAHGTSNLIVTADGETYGFQELGSGIGHFTVALVNLAIQQPAPTWILIDEPENGLHPTLQQSFLTALGELSTEGVVFATHSYGLARRVAQQTYLVRRNGKSGSTVVDHRSAGSLSEFVGELGFSAYNDLGYDGVLLVESPTDSLTFDQWLKTRGYTGSVVIVPLGGAGAMGNAAAQQLTELRRLSPRIAAIIDSEHSSSGATLGEDRQRFVRACADLQIPCHVLERRATENYLTSAALQNALGCQYESLGAFQKLSEATSRWSKGQNWRVAQEMSNAELDESDLGAALDTAIRTFNSVVT